MKIKHEGVGFTQVANSVLTRKDLSLKAKGLFALLYSKPDDWAFSADRIVLETQEVRATIQATLRELEDVGLLRRKKEPNGKTLYFIGYSGEEKPKDENHPLGKKPKDEICSEQKTLRAKNVPYNNTENPTNTDSETKTDFVASATSDGAVDGVNDLFKVFYDTVNRGIKFSNRTIRKDAEWLIKELGKEKAISVAKWACSVQGQPFAPTITTPSQLREKLGALKIFSDRLKSENQNLKPNQQWHVAR